ncbi:hypothetical protein CRD60_08570, partial [Bifidobacterium aemilianum]
SGSGSSGAAGSRLAGMSEVMRRSVMDVVRASYATGSGKVFAAMAVLSLGFVLLALAYPRKRTDRR